VADVLYERVSRSTRRNRIPGERNGEGAVGADWTFTKWATLEHVVHGHVVNGHLVTTPAIWQPVVFGQPRPGRVLMRDHVGRVRHGFV
jgi:hypothetical protein